MKASVDKNIKLPGVPIPQCSSRAQSSSVLPTGDEAGKEHDKAWLVIGRYGGVGGGDWWADSW